MRIALSITYHGNRQAEPVALYSCKDLVKSQYNKPEQEEYNTVSFIHIHEENTALAVRPLPTVRLATMNISDVPESSSRYSLWILIAARMTPQKTIPRPISKPYAVP